MQAGEVSAAEPGSKLCGGTGIVHLYALLCNGGNAIQPTRFDSKPLSAMQVLSSAREPLWETDALGIVETANRGTRAGWVLAILGERTHQSVLA